MRLIVVQKQEAAAGMPGHTAPEFERRVALRMPAQQAITSAQQGPLSPGGIGRFLVPESHPKRLLYAELSLAKSKTRCNSHSWEAGRIGIFADHRRRRNSQIHDSWSFETVTSQRAEPTSTRRTAYGPEIEFMRPLR